MMEFLSILTAEDFRVKKIYDSYLTAFPENERRSDSQFLALFKNPHASVKSSSLEGENIGYLVVWNLSEFLYIEHFEVFPDFRGQNMGSQVMQNLNKEYSRIVLEAEPEDLDELAKRRIGFYKRNGFVVSDKDYIQPSYGPGKSALNLYLLTSWNAEDTNLIKEELYDIVYRF